jgi:hypothetical protein
MQTTGVIGVCKLDRFLQRRKKEKKEIDEILGIAVHFILKMRLQIIIFQNVYHLFTRVL